MERTRVIYLSSIGRIGEKLLEFKCVTFTKMKMYISLGRFIK
jgi:hypothetical protein